jgi:PadR family transcriptional regulator PadR
VTHSIVWDVAPTDRDPLAAHVQELRRGTVVLACLELLQRPAYGYALLETLQECGLQVDANTLYPLLRRLEGQGLLEGEWNTEESRPRKFYRCTSQGRAVLRGLRQEWADLVAAIDHLTREEP